MAKRWHRPGAGPGTRIVGAVASAIADRIVRAAERSQSETGRYVIPGAIALGISLGGAVRKTGEIRDRHPRGEDLRQAVLELVGFLQGACERLGARMVPEKPVTRKTSRKKTARKKRSVGKKGRKKR